MLNCLRITHQKWKNINKNETTYLLQSILSFVAAFLPEAELEEYFIYSKAWYIIHLALNTGHHQLSISIYYESYMAV